MPSTLPTPATTRPALTTGTVAASASAGVSAAVRRVRPRRACARAAASEGSSGKKPGVACDRAGKAYCD